MIRKIPREVYIQYVRDGRTGGTHNVLEVCSKDTGVRFVMALDSETAKERDRYKLRASLLEADLAALQKDKDEWKRLALSVGDVEGKDIELDALREFCRTEIRKLPPGYVKGKAHLPDLEDL